MLQEYKYQACKPSVKALVFKCLLNGCGLRSVLAITKVAVSTQLRWIRKEARVTDRTQIYQKGDSYEVDELRSYVGNKKKPIWVISAKSRATGEIVEVKVGRRTKKNIQTVIDKLLLLNPKYIYTDGLKEYRTIIPEEYHKVIRYGTNKIKRHHLTLRTHLKRLARRTICYSKNEEILYGLIRAYSMSYKAQ